jgi:hypothetical protein
VQADTAEAVVSALSALWQPWTLRAVALSWWPVERTFFCVVFCVDVFVGGKRKMRGR